MLLLLLLLLKLLLLLILLLLLLLLQQHLTAQHLSILQHHIAALSCVVATAACSRSYLVSPIVRRRLSTVATVSRGGVLARRLPSCRSHRVIS